MSAGIQSNMAVNAQDHLLYCNHLGKCFANKEVLRDIQLTAEPGDIVALLRPNGAGKSTLMGCLIVRYPDPRVLPVPAESDLAGHGPLRPRQTLFPMTIGIEGFHERTVGQGGELARCCR